MLHTLKHSYFLRISLLFFLSFCVSAANITNGGSPTGSVSPIGDIDTWTFSADAGENIVVQVAEISGSSFEPFLRLYDTKGVLLSSNSGTNSTNVSGTATVAGTYTVEVLDASSTPDGTGTYKLYLATTASTFGVPSGDEGGALQNGGVAAGDIDLADIDLWTFTANGAGTAHIQVGETADNGNFDPQILLYDSFGHLMASNWGTKAADLTVNLPVAGKYTVLVNEASSDVPSTGSYHLFLAVAGDDLIVPASDEGGALTPGGVHAGTIGLADTDAWTFSASQSETVLIQVGETADNGNFDPEILLYDAFGALVASNWGATAADLRVSLPSAGEYTVVVKEASTDVPSTGAYNVYFTKTGQTNAVPNNDEGGVLTNGGIHPGEIKLGDVDAWTFNAEAGETVIIQAGETADSGNFDPELRLYNSLGQEVASNWGATATDLAVTLPVGGIYTVVVKEASSDVPSTGAYNLYFANTGQANSVPTGDEGGTLINGGIHSGDIDLGDVDHWTFDAETGETVLIQAGETADHGNFDVELRLYDSQGGFVASNWGTTGTDLTAVIHNGGTHTVIVKEASSDVPATGSYNLYFANTGKAFTVPGGDDGGGIASGTTETGVIDHADIDSWSFNVAAGDQIDLTLTETVDDGGFDPLMRLYDPQGRLVASDSGSVTASISATASYGGQYHVAVREASSDVPSTGSYELSYARTVAGINLPGGPIIESIQNGEKILGVANANQDTDKYSLSVVAGEMVHVRMGDRASGAGSNMWPGLQVFSPTGDLLATSDGNGYASVVFEAPATETLTVVAFNTSDVTSAYSYELTAAIASQSLATSAGDQGKTLGNGEKIEGFAHPGDLDVFKLAVSAGEAVHVRMGDRASGVGSNMWPGLQVFSSTGGLLATSDGNGYAAVVFEAPATETLTVVGFNTSDVDAGYDYELTAAIASQGLATSAGDQGKTLGNGEKIEGFAHPGDLDVFKLAVSAGEAVHVRMGDRASGVGSNMWPGLQVFSPTGGLLATSDGNGYAAVVFEAPATETLTVLGFNTSDVDAGYDYELTAAIASQGLATSAGDQGKTLGNGEKIEGFAHPGDLDVFKLAVSAGEAVHVRMGDRASGAGSNMWPGLQVFSAAGSLLASANANGNTGVLFEAPASETLTVVAYNTSDVAAGYDYELTAAIVSQNLATSAGDQGKILNNGEKIEGFLHAGDLDVFKLAVTAGEAVHVKLGDRASGAGSNMWPGLQVFSAAGNLLVSANANGNTGVRFEAPATETLTVVAYNTSDVAAGYEYGLSVAAASGAFKVVEGDQGGGLKNSVTVAGTISVGDSDIFVFSAASGEQVSVQYEDLSAGAGSNYNPETFLYNSSMRRIAQENADSSFQIDFDAPATDVYYLVIANSSDSTSSGNYNLTVSGISDSINSDPDSLIDAFELMIGTSRTSEDTDKDGLWDDVETNTGTFTSPTDTGTNPVQRDTDGDGFFDGLEVREETDPNDSNSVPVLKIPMPLWALLLLSGCLGIIGYRQRRAR